MCALYLPYRFDKGENKMSVGLRHKIMQTLYGGIKDPLNKITEYSGSPNGALTAEFTGQLCWDYTDGTDVYINTYTSATTWVKIYD